MSFTVDSLPIVWDHLLMAVTVARYDRDSRTEQERDPAQA